MAISTWDIDNTLGDSPCKTAMESWQCPNMLPLKNDKDMNYENYICKLCGKTVRLDYDEMR